MRFKNDLVLNLMFSCLVFILLLFYCINVIVPATGMGKNPKTVWVKKGMENLYVLLHGHGLSSLCLRNCRFLFASCFSFSGV